MPNKYNPTQHKVKIQTWGTKDKESNGIDNFVEQTFFGGNVGHASIVISLPYNEETMELIKKYCYKQTFEEYKATCPEPENVTFAQFVNNVEQVIPADLKTHTTYLSRMDADGKLQKTDEIANQYKNIEIEFSWWPASDGTYFLSHTDEDMKNEREGRHVDYKPEVEALVHPEMRRHSGILGSQLQSYPISQIVHATGISEEVLKKIGLKYRLNKLEEMYALKNVIISKINEMKTTNIENTTLGLMCKNIELDFTQVTKEYLERHADDPQKENLEQFKEFFIRKVKHYMNESLKERDQILDQLDELSDIVVDENILTRGIHPDNTVTLPLLDEESRGLSPEAMLKAIRALIDVEDAHFDLQTMNCSKTSTAVLSAGAAHDPLLHHALSEQAFGFFGTPQQVLGNARRARAILTENKENTLLTQIGNINFLQKAMGKLLASIMDQNSSAAEKSLAWTGLAFVALARLPGALTKELLAPTQAIENISAGMSTVYKNADSNALKAGLSVLSAAPIVALSPFAGIEQGLKEIIRVFETKEGPKESTPQIITPLPSAIAQEAIQGESYLEMATRMTAQAENVDKKIAEEISEHVQELATGKKTVPQIINAFRKALDQNLEDIITLSAQDMQKVELYLEENEHPDLAKKFQGCCEESIARSNRLSIKKPAEIDDLGKVDITDHIIILDTTDKTVPEIIDEFRTALNRNPNDIITLSSEDWQKINLYLEGKGDTDLAKTFLSCCDESIERSNKFDPKTPIDNLENLSIDDLIKLYTTDEGLKKLGM